MTSKYTDALVADLRVKIASKKRQINNLNMDAASIIANDREIKLLKETIEEAKNDLAKRYAELRDVNFKARLDALAEELRVDLNLLRALGVDVEAEEDNQLLASLTRNISHTEDTEEEDINDSDDEGDVHELMVPTKLDMDTLTKNVSQAFINQIVAVLVHRYPNPVRSRDIPKFFKSQAVTAVYDASLEANGKRYACGRTEYSTYKYTTYCKTLHRIMVSQGLVTLSKIKVGDTWYKAATLNNTPEVQAFIETHYPKTLNPIFSQRQRLRLVSSAAAAE